MKRKTHSLNQPQRRVGRHGSLLVCVLVCMGIALSIMLTSVHASLRERRQVARELQMEQTRWLADAGLTRGIMKLTQDAGYTGETWEVTPVIREDQLATIEISVTTSDDDTGSVRLSASATIRGDQLNSQPTRHTASVVIDSFKVAGTLRVPSASMRNQETFGF